MFIVGQMVNLFMLVKVVDKDLVNFQLEVTTTKILLLSMAEKTF